MSELRKAWRRAERKWRWARSSLPAAVADDVLAADGGADALGRHLAALERAGDDRTRRRAWDRASPILVGYQEAVARAAARPELSWQARRALGALIDAVDDVELWAWSLMIEPAPPPTGRTVSIVLVRRDDAARPVRTTWLDLGEVTVDAVVAVDAALDDLAMSGRLGFGWVELAAACEGRTDRILDRLDVFVARLDGKVGDGGARERAQVLHKVDLVLGDHVRMLEEDLVAVVDDHWERAGRRVRDLDALTSVARVTVHVTTDEVRVRGSVGASAPRRDEAVQGSPAADLVAAATVVDACGRALDVAVDQARILAATADVSPARGRRRDAALAAVTAAARASDDAIAGLLDTCEALAGGRHHRLGATAGPPVDLARIERLVDRLGHDRARLAPLVAQEVGEGRDALAHAPRSQPALPEVRRACAAPAPRSTDRTGPS